MALYGRRAAARLLLARFDEAARDYQAMLERARAARLPAAECEALSGLCNAHFFEQRHARDVGARARRRCRRPSGSARPTTWPRRAAASRRRW